MYITTYLTFNSESNSASTYVINTTDSNVGDYHYIMPEDITAKVWNDIAEKILNVYSTHDSYIIICDKSIIPSTATALSFIMENLSKPVILTTSTTFKKTLKMAKNTSIPEVMVYHKGKHIRGVRTITDPLKGFISPYYPSLTIKNAFQVPIQDMSLMLINPDIIVSIVNVFPGMTAKSFKKMGGVILDATTMNIPTSTEFVKDLTSIINKGTIVVIVTNNTKVDPKILKTGVIFGKDMTITSAYTKLCFLLSNISDKSVIPQIMNQSLRGEITI